MLEKLKQEFRVLKESEQFYRNIVACSPDTIFVHTNGIIKFANPAAIKFFCAADQKELINKPIWTIIPEEFHQLVKERIQHAFYGKDGLTPVIEMQLIRLNGELVDVDVTGCAISYKGKPAIQVIVRDISNRKRAESMLKEKEKRLKIDKENFRKMVRERSEQLIEALIELEKSRHLSSIGTLAATVAHELRNPLAAISIAAFNIKNKTCEPELVGPHLQTIESKVIESDQIINNLLLYSRIKPPCLENIHVFDIVTECLKVIRAKCKKKISVKRACGKAKRAVIKADPLQIREVINNILNNACEALPNKGGKLLINASDEGKFIKIYFKDNGTGISKENLDKVFNPFFTTKSYGTGLGLTVSRQILNLHNGTINIESKLNKGTAVTITLPKK